MRLVVRIVLFEFSLAWAMMLAGCLRAGLQIWPFLTGPLRACGRAWRPGPGALIGFPVTAGWPLLFWLRQAQPGYRSWLQGIAIPWWVVLSVTGLMVLIARLSAAEPSAGPDRSRRRCGTCAAGEAQVLPS